MIIKLQIKFMFVFKITIIDYRMGSLRFRYNKLKKMNLDCNISSNIQDFMTAEKLILPGGGHFKCGM